ncbi:hypothetical protein C7I85_25675 [Mesorhizobium soli]|uniref:Uncharacterized protein n=1 Tax=Pseudaminobacter soli (ex Li et al. 2025) TaxID=1295366 RepID=A0A2P7S0V9_9HYPH|nr:hypothetical protein C7I85_25675 [Mesorhizobium soli]
MSKAFSQCRQIFQQRLVHSGQTIVFTQGLARYCADQMRCVTVHKNRPPTGSAGALPPLFQSIDGWMRMWDPDRQNVAWRHFYRKGRLIVLGKTEDVSVSSGCCEPLNRKVGQADIFIAGLCPDDHNLWAP